jgi:hypothetical protein
MVRDSLPFRKPATGADALDPTRHHRPHDASPQPIAVAVPQIRLMMTLMASPNGIAKLPRIKPGRRGTLAQILDLQRMLYQTALDPETTPSARAQVTRAWCELDERKRIVRMKPKPRDVDVEKLRLAKARSQSTGATFTESPEG